MAALCDARHIKKPRANRAKLQQAAAKLLSKDDARIAEALTAVETTKERWYEAEINRISGEIALKLPQLGAPQAQKYFERALAIARAQHAKSWELRAAMSVARFWRDQGVREKGKAVLAPVCGWFTEGFETHDLKQAKTLLAEMS